MSWLSNTICVFYSHRKLVVCLVLSLGLIGCADKPDLQAGAKIVAANCKVCHAQGINGAPIIGNQKMWNKRISKGKDALVANAISGVGLMPAKGGKPNLSDADIEFAVAYLLSQVNN